MSKIQVTQAYPKFEESPSGTLGLCRLKKYLEIFLFLSKVLKNTCQYFIFIFIVIFLFYNLFASSFSTFVGQTSFKKKKYNTKIYITHDIQRQCYHCYV